MRNRPLILGLVIGLSGLTSLASAEPSTAERVKARELMAAGRAQRAAKDLPAALTSFASANAIMHVPPTLFEIAATQAELGRLVAALGTLQDLAQLPGEESEPEQFRKARNAGAELAITLKPRLASLDVTLDEHLEAEQSTLSIDGGPSLKGSEFRHIWLDPGKHQLVAARGSARREQTVWLAEGEMRMVELLLKPSAAVVLDSERPNKALSPVPGATPWAAYALGGVGVAGLGAGLGFFMQARHVKSSLESSCAPTCTSEQTARVQRWNTASGVSFGIGSAALVAAVVVFLVHSSQTEAKHDDSPRAVAFRFEPTIGGATLEAAGRF